MKIKCAISSVPHLNREGYHPGFFITVKQLQIRDYHCSVADNGYMTREGMNYIWISLKKKDKTIFTMHFSRSNGVLVLLELRFGIFSDVFVDIPYVK